MMDIQSEDVGGTFYGGGLTEEGLLVPVLTLPEDNVTNVGPNKRTLCAFQCQVEPREISDE